MSTGVETRQFQAEARQLLDLMIHSVYSNRDIFLRELISNASDALDRLRFEAIAHPELLPEGTELRILIETDPEARTLTVHDNGIGMTREEVVEHIGTIAKSGTKEFLGALQQAKQGEVPPELIGQFGVGFYATFMVAGSVTLVTRKAGQPGAVRWESTGEGSYTLEDAVRDEPGTSITLHLKEADEEDALGDYTQEWKVREIVKKYSDFVAYPIQMDIERTKPAEEEGGEETKTVERQTLNSMKAIWLRSPSGVSDEEYNEFYKHISHDWTEPLERIQASIEGTLMYRMLLFIPSQAPFDLYFREGRRGVQLYVKRVFIMDDCQDLLPEYLRFVKGVVDSEDLSLNISREILQQNRQIQRMRKGIVGKVLEALSAMKDKDEAKYRTFWQQFGPVLKEGAFQDHENRAKLLDLFLFDSTAGDERTSLRAYAGRMKPGQDAIYYVTGRSRGAAEASPHIEAFREKGYEVLLLTDNVDEVWTQYAPEFDGKPLKSIARGDVELGSEEERKQAEETRKEKQEAHKSLLEALKKPLEDYVKDVRFSARLTESPACIVGDMSDMSPQLEQILRAAGQEAPAVKRILELNPAHPILDKLQGIHDADAGDPRIGEYARLLYGQAVLAEGQQPPDPAAFSRLVAKLMVDAAG